MRRFLIGIFMLALIGTSFGAYPNWHFKDSTFPYWRIESGAWKFQTGATPPTSDLILQYLMGANGSESTITLDTSGNNYTGTVANATWNQATNGITDYYDFPNTTDKITFSNDIELNTGEPFTLSGWVYNDAFTDTYPVWIFVNQNASTAGYKVGFSSNATYKDLYFGCGSGGWYKGDTGDIGLTLDTWHHILLTYNGLGAGTATNFVLHINGVLTAHTASGALNTTAGDNTIGVDSAGSDWDGFITLVEIHTNALTASEVLATNRTQAVELGILSEYVQANLSDGLVFDWEANSLLDDGSTNSATMSTASAPTPLGDATNGWFSFNGVGNTLVLGDLSYLSFTDGAGTDKPFSMSVWVNASSFGTDGFISKISGGTEWSMLTVGGKIYMVLYSGGGTGTYIGRIYNTALPTSQWIHLVVTYDGSEASSGVKIYKDAVRVDDLNYQAGTYVGMNNTAGSAKLADHSGQFYAGLMDAVHIFDAELSATAVTNLYNSGRGN